MAPENLDRPALHPPVPNRLLAYQGRCRSRLHRQFLATIPKIGFVDYTAAMNKRLTKISKYLAFILRHEPGSIGLKPDPYGFLNVEELVKAANASGKSITVEQVHQVVAGHEDKLFALSDDGTRIRAV